MATLDWSQCPAVESIPGKPPAASTRPCQGADARSLRQHVARGRCKVPGMRVPRGDCKRRKGRYGVDWSPFDVKGLQLPVWKKDGRQSTSSSNRRIDVFCCWLRRRTSARVRPNGRPSFCETYPYTRLFLRASTSFWHCVIGSIFGGIRILSLLPPQISKAIPIRLLLRI